MARKKKREKGVFKKLLLPLYLCVQSSQRVRLTTLQNLALVDHVASPLVREPCYHELAGPSREE